MIKTFRKRGRDLKKKTNSEKKTKNQIRKVSPYFLLDENISLGSNDLLYTDFNREKNDNRIVPKSIKPESKCLLITNLQRPFSNTILKELLSKTGIIKKFWLDFIKTHCYLEVFLFLFFSMKHWNKLEIPDKLFTARFGLLV